MKKDSINIIGEIGQNHNGSLDLAKLIIDMINRPIKEELFGLSLPPINAIKLTKRDLKEELTASEMNRPYESIHSFGKTYGEHRQFLELNDEDHYQLYKYTKENYQADFIETICSTGAMSILKYFMPDFLKVASRDLTNLPLLNALAETKTPMILSTGMGGKKELDNALETITKHHERISILHCVSQYPTNPKNVNLKSIKYLKKHYSKYTIGYSDHTVGIATPLAAVAMGAKIIEKHVTIDRKMKGTDQIGSLGPEGVNRMIRDIRLFEMSTGKVDIFISDDIQSTKYKLERSIAAKRDIKKGEKISEKDLHLLSPGNGIQWSDKALITGKIAKIDLRKDELIQLKMIKK